MTGPRGGRKGRTMIDPPIEKLIDKVGGRFDLVVVAARRARDINNYYTQLGGGIGQYAPPQVMSQSQKPLTIALEEIAADKLTARAEEEESPAGGDGLLTLNEGGSG